MLTRSQVLRPAPTPAPPCFPDSGPPLCFSGSSVLLIRPFVREFIHSFIHSLTHSLTRPVSSWQRLGIKLCSGHTMSPGRFRAQGLALLLTVQWQDLSLLVSESHVRVIPSDKVSPRLKLPFSSYLHQPISTCLSILMAYSSRRESPNERKLVTVLIGLKKTTGGEVFFKNTHKKQQPKEM